MISSDPELEELRRQAAHVHLEWKEAKARNDLERAEQLDQELRRLKAIIVDRQRERDRAGR